MIKKLVLAIASSLIFSTPAIAAEPTAIVAEIDAPRLSVSLMELLDPGKSIDLGEDGMLVLGYLHSCLQERITGGKVTIGLDHSVVKRGRVIRELVECNGGELLLTADQAARSGVLVFRRP